MDDSPRTSPSALVSLYLEKRAALVRFFTLRTSSPAEAEDIVQDVYLKIAHLDPGAVENPAAFLYRLGTNAMLDRARTRRRGVARDGAYQEAHQAGGPGEPEAEAPDADAAIDARRRLEALLALVEEMPAQRRTVFVLHKIEGLSYAEVAARLGVSRSAVEKHMMAALRQLTANRE